MSCYQCGSPHGTSIFLCPSCLKQKRESHVQKVDDVRASFVSEHKAFSVYSVTHAWEFQVFLAVVTFVTTSIALLLFGPLKDNGTTATLILAGMTTATAAAFLSWTVFWFKMLISEPMWAIMSLIMPAFAYRYVAIAWDEDEGIKRLFILHCVSVVLSLGLTVALAKVLDASVLEIYFRFKLWVEAGTFDQPPSAGGGY